MHAALLAIDWGTSSLRGALLATDGTVLASHAAPRGLLSVPVGGWAAVFAAEFGTWLAAHPGLPCLLAGMVGSRQGWVEAPYCPCPTSLADLAAHLCVVPLQARPVDAQPTSLAQHALAIVPGLCTEAAGIPDVLRGEETQVFGALQLLGLADADQVTLVLPGTHSKWVAVQRGHITGFATHMTGECYALLRQQSILARTLPALDDNSDSTWVADAFDAGIAQAQTAGGLLHHVFSVRSLALMQRQDGAALASRLSGLLIGEELRAQTLPAGQAVVLVGGDGLTQRYQRALQQLGVVVQTVGPEATWRGLAALAGLQAGSPGGQAGSAAAGTLQA